MSGRIQSLDGIRGYAAFCVLVYHAILAFDGGMIQRVLHKPFVEMTTAYDLWAKLWLTLLSGEAAVILFFLLSGCVLILSLEKDFARHPPLRTAIAFAVRRELRIYPAAIVCVLGIYAAVSVHYWLDPSIPFPFTPGMALSNMLLYSPDVNGASWTLTIEMLAVPFLIVAGYLMHRFGWPVLLGFLAFCVLARSESTLFFGSELLAQHLYYFAFGCLVPYAASRRAAEFAARIGWLPLLLGFLFVRPLLPFGFKILLLQAALGFLFLALIYHRPPPRLNAFLLRPISQFFGRISYGFYLWHALFITMVIRLSYPYPEFNARHAVELGLLVSVPGVVITAWLGDLSERYVERPGITLGRWLSGLVLARPEAAVVSQPAAMPEHVRS